jgi:hypothetical protein
MAESAQPLPIVNRRSLSARVSSPNLALGVDECQPDKLGEGIQSERPVSILMAVLTGERPVITVWTFS